MKTVAWAFPSTVYHARNEKQCEVGCSIMGCALYTGTSILPQRGGPEKGVRVILGFLRYVIPILW